MQELSLNDIDKRYPWLTKSTFYKELTEKTEYLDDEEISDYLKEKALYKVCYEEEQNYKLLLDVINFWGVTEIPHEILTRFSKIEKGEFIHYLLECITSLELKLFYEKFILFSSLMDEQRLCKTMAYYGYLDVVKWCLKYTQHKDEVIINAIKGGHLEIVKYLLGEVKIFHSLYIDHAINHKRLDILHYFFDKNLFKKEQHLFKIALMYSSREIIDFLYEEGYDLDYDNCFSGEKVNVEGLKWVYEKKPINVRELAYRILDIGSLEGFKWIYEKGFRPEGKQHFQINFNIEILKFLKSQNFQFSIVNFTYSFLANDVEIINFFLSEGFRLTSSLLEYYLENSNYLNADILFLFREKNVPVTDDILVTSVKKASYENFKRLLENDYPYDYLTIFREFCENINKTAYQLDKMLKKFDLFLSHTDTEINVEIMCLFLYFGNEYLFQKYHGDFYDINFYEQFYDNFEYITNDILDMIYVTYKKMPSNKLKNKDEVKEWMRKL